MTRHRKAVKSFANRKHITPLRKKDDPRIIDVMRFIFGIENLYVDYIDSPPDGGKPYTLLHLPPLGSFVIQISKVDGVDNVTISPAINTGITFIGGHPWQRVTLADTATWPFVGDDVAANRRLMTAEYTHDRQVLGEMTARELVTRLEAATMLIPSLDTSNPETQIWWTMSFIPQRDAEVVTI